MRLTRGRPRLSIVARIAVVAGVLTSMLLVCGALLVRAALHTTQLDATRQLAEVQAAQIVDATRSGVLLYGSFGSLPYELVRSDGAVVASSPELADAEMDGPLMPPPAGDAPQIGGQVWPARLVPGESTGGARVAVSDTLRASSIAVSADDLPGGPFADPDTAVYRAYVFVTTTAADDAVATVDPYLWSAVVLMVALVVGTAATTARRSLRPVELMRRAAEAIGGAPEGARVVVPHTADELAALAVTLNAMLARIDEAVIRQRRFTADAAHELRSPIASITTALDIAQAHPDVMPAEQVVAHVGAEARRLVELAEDLLDLAAPVSGGSQPQVVCSDAGSVLLDVLADARAQSPRVDITWAGATPTGPVPVQVTSGRLRRVLTNLVDNAVRHASTHVIVSIDVDITTSVVRTEIANDGTPIPDEDLTRIFEPFVRLDGSRSRNTGGAGLGLTIAHEIVSRAGGTLTATSTSTRTSFVICLPQ